MSHLKRVFALLAALLFLQLPMEALAKIEVQTVERDISQITTFAGELPEELDELLTAKGFADYACYSGAMLEYNIARAGRLGNGREFAMALVAFEKEDERILVGMHSYALNPWTIENLGAKALLPGREFSIDVPELINEQMSEQRFFIRYPLPDGGTGSYGLQVFNELWCVGTYEEVDAKGNGQFISSDDPPYGFRVGVLPLQEAAASDAYFAYFPPYLAYMNNIEDFPTNGEAARRIAEESWQRFEGTDLALCYGVNLREAPTTSSKSLGMFNECTLVHVLGKEKGRASDWARSAATALLQALGKEKGHALDWARSAATALLYKLNQREAQIDPWYHVRVGRLEGWMYGVYVKFPRTEDFSQALRHGSLPVAHTTDSRILRASPGNNAESIAELPTGTLMHVLATVEGGWLYVMVPREPLSWEMDVDGMSGYLRKDEVAQGASEGTIAP